MPSTPGNMMVLTAGIVAASLFAVDRLRTTVTAAPGAQPFPSSSAPSARTASAPSAGAASFSSDRIERLTARGGHFWAEASINGARIQTLVDTGASLVVLSETDAERIGVFRQPGDRKAMFNTANGRVEGHLTKLREIRVGDIVVRDVEAAVLPREALGKTLLGMSFLSRLRGYDVRGDTLLLRH